MKEIIASLVKIADYLDAKNRVVESDIVSGVLTKLSEHVGEDQDPIVHVVNIPKPFDGDVTEKMANHNSHNFLWDDEGDTRCMNCDARPSHEAANYPCGAVPERIFRIHRASGAVEHMTPEQYSAVYGEN